MFDASQKELIKKIYISENYNNVEVLIWIDHIHVVIYLKRKDRGKQKEIMEFFKEGNK